MNKEADREIFKTLTSSDEEFKNSVSVLKLGKEADDIDRHGFLSLYKETENLPQTDRNNLRSFLRFARTVGITFAPAKRGMEIIPGSSWDKGEWNKLFNQLPVWYTDWIKGVLLRIA